MRRSSGGRQIIALLNVVEQTKLAGKMSRVWFRASGSFPCQRDGELESMLQRQVSWPSLMRMFENPVIKTSYHKEQDGGGWALQPGRERERQGQSGFHFPNSF